MISKVNTEHDRNDIPQRRQSSLVGLKMTKKRDVDRAWYAMKTIFKLKKTVMTDAIRHFPV